MRRRRAVPWPTLALTGLILGTLVGFLVYPPFPNYESYYSLLWGREVLHGTLPSFDAYRAPTQHPLEIAFGAVLALVGDGGDRILVFATVRRSSSSPRACTGSRARRSRRSSGAASRSTRRAASRCSVRGFTPDVSDVKDIRNSLPMPGSTRVAATGFYGAYVRC